MRTNITLSIEATTVDQLRDAAMRLDVPMSALTDLLVRIGIERHWTGLEQWAGTARRSRSAVPRNAGMTPSQAALLASMTDKETELRDCAKRAGQPIHVTWTAMTGLKARGLIEGRENGFYLNGRPCMSWWKLKAATDAK